MNGILAAVDEKLLPFLMGKIPITLDFPAITEAITFFCERKLRFFL